MEKRLQKKQKDARLIVRRSVFYRTPSSTALFARCIQWTELWTAQIQSLPAYFMFLNTCDTLIRGVRGGDREY